MIICTSNLGTNIKTNFFQTFRPQELQCAVVHPLSPAKANQQHRKHRVTTKLTNQNAVLQFINQ